MSFPRKGSDASASEPVIAPPGAPRVTEEEEAPLEILDYSCTTIFEEVVKDVEMFLLDTLQTRSELAGFLFAPASPIPSSSSSSSLASSGSLLSFPSDSLCPSGWGDGSAASRSPAKGGNWGSGESSNGPHGNGAITGPLVIGRNFPLGRGDCSDADLCVELHVFDFQHPVGRQFCPPLFLLVRSTMQQKSYHDTESTYYLSILATAAGNVFSSRLTLDVGAHPGLDAYLAAAYSCEAGTTDGSAWPLPSPHGFQPNCVPCFVPAGDSFQLTFTGCSPPLVVPFARRPRAGQTAQETFARMLLGQPTLATRFHSSAHGEAPVGCRHLSDFVDLFQLQIGQRSRVQADDVEGTCVSVWKRFRLTTPWRYRLGGPAAAAAGVQGLDRLASHATAVTWNEALERENEALLVLCGPHTHSYGTNAVPLECLLFDFQWNQLRDAEAQETATRSYLNPFALPTSAIGKEVNRKCAVVARGVARAEEDLRHTATGHVRELANLLLGRVNDRLDFGTHAGSNTGAPVDAEGYTGGAENLRQHVEAILSGGLHSAAAHEGLIGLLQDDDDDSGGWDSNSNAISNSKGEEEARGRLTALLEAVKERRGVGGGGASPTLLRASPPNNKKKSGSGIAKDLRRGYFPSSLLSRVAHLCAVEDASNRLAAEDVYTLWRTCVAELKVKVDRGGSEGVAAALECLGLPVAEPAVDLSQPILVQKLQMLAFCLRSMLLRRQAGTAQQPTDGWDEDLMLSGSDEGSPTTGRPPQSPNSDWGGGGGRHPDASSSARRQLYLITNGEPVGVPPPLSRPPSTSDTLLRRAKQMNELGATAVAQATRAWLQSDSLYNDMCLFLHVNEAQSGRKVRFPDFIQWHSPRDFCPPPSLRGASDDDYLSERMRSGRDGPGARPHVWASLWARAVPRSRSQIIADSFHAPEEAALVLHWLEAEITESTLLLEVVNAAIANALHRLLCSRFVVAPQQSPTRATVPTLRFAGSVVPGVRRYVRQRCSSLSANLEAAATIFLSAPHGGVITTMEFEGLANMYAVALRELDEIETCVCAALAMECLLGKDNVAIPEGARLVQGVSAPTPRQSDVTRLTLCDHPVPLATWAALVADRFECLPDRAPVHTRVRITCMAERPLNTTNCFQQLVVDKHGSGVLRLALVLSHEII